MAENQPDSNGFGQVVQSRDTIDLIATTGKEDWTVRPLTEAERERLVQVRAQRIKYGYLPGSDLPENPHTTN